MKTINASSLHSKLKSGENCILIDVREDWEREIFSIGGTPLPMSEIFDRIDEMPDVEEAILYCEKGIRSALIIQRLQQTSGFSNLVNLEGGMTAWKKLGLSSIK